MASGLARPIRVVALTSQGAALARMLSRELPGGECWLSQALATEEHDRPFARLSQVFAEAFGKRENLVAIMAAGIVVRTVAPFLQGKDTDPAVVVVDEEGRFAISLLSGHLGGANDLAREVARILDGTPVITTATDVHGLPALDLLAQAAGLQIENLAGVRRVNMALLEGRRLRLIDPEGCLGEILTPYQGHFEGEDNLDQALAVPGPAVYVGIRKRAWPDDWLILRPRILVAGVGCHKSTPAAELVAFITEIFQREQLSLLSLKALATIEHKKDEPGLIAAARQLGVELIWFPAAELRDIPVPHPSPQPARHVGTASVSEAAALRAGGVELIVPKQKSPNATLAVARVA